MTLSLLKESLLFALKLLTGAIEALLFKSGFQKPNTVQVKQQLHDAIFRLRFYSNSSIYILSLSNSHNNVASIQNNRGDKSQRVIVALGYNYMVRFIAPILL